MTLEFTRNICFRGKLYTLAGWVHKVTFLLMAKHYEKEQSQNVFVKYNIGHFLVVLAFWFPDKGGNRSIFVFISTIMNFIGKKQILPIVSPGNLGFTAL